MRGEVTLAPLASSTQDCARKGVEGLVLVKLALTERSFPVMIKRVRSRATPAQAEWTTAASSRPQVADISTRRIGKEDWFFIAVFIFLVKRSGKAARHCLVG